MKSFAFLAIVTSLLGASRTLAAPTETDLTSACANEQVVATTYIGKDKNVKVTLSNCDDSNACVASSLTKRQNNVCGAPCETYCWSGSATGPTSGDCTVIADAMLYDSEIIGANFQISAVNTTTNKITMQYDTCLTYFLNQDFSTLTYCYTEWSKLVNWLSSDCSAANGSYGGLCVANDQRWYVQLQHS